MWLSEFKVFQYIVNENVKGQGVTSADMRKQLQVCIPLEARCAWITAYLSNLAQQRPLENWAQNVKRKWRLCFTEMPMRNLATDSEIRRKAPPKGSTEASFLDRGYPLFWTAESRF